MAVNENLAADGRVEAAKLALPKRVADHRTWQPATGAVVFSGEQAAPERRHTQRSERLAADKEAASALGLRTLTKRDFIATAPSKNTRKSFLMGADLLPERVGEIVSGSADPKSSISAANLNLGQLARTRHRQAAQTHSVEQLKNRRVCSDS